MEMFIIAVVAVVAFAAALYPLMKRRGPVGIDEDEFEGTTPAPPARRAPAIDEQPDADMGADADADVDAGVDVVTGEGVVPPMAAGPATPVAPVGFTTPAGEPAAGGDSLERDVARYREALRAGTICRKCGEANPPESRFCGDCGAALPLTESQEFD